MPGLVLAASTCAPVFCVASACCVPLRCSSLWPRSLTALPKRLRAKAGFDSDDVCDFGGDAVVDNIAPIEPASNLMTKA